MSKKNKVKKVKEKMGLVLFLGFWVSSFFWVLG
jgi:hypothetical protein